jgi:ERF superfamily
MSNAIQKVDALPVRDETVAMLEMISRAASDPAVDISKLERLMAMRDKMLAQQAEQAYAASMVRAQRLMPKVVKDRDNTQTRSRYATLEAVNRQVVPVYTAEGFSLSYGEEDCPTAGHVRVGCDVMHSGGHSKHYHYDNPIDDAGLRGEKNKTPTHGRASAISYARRYLVVLIFNLTIVGEDDDGNGVGLGTISEEQEATLSDMIAATSADKPAFLKYMGVEHLSDIPAPSYQRALGALKAKERVKAKETKA